MHLYRPMMGNDPEILVKANGKVVPGETLLPNTKQLEYPALKYDNAAVELQPGPALCLQQQNNWIAAAFRNVFRLIVDKKLEKSAISIRPAEEIEESDIKTMRSCSQFGCEPAMVFDGEHLDINRPTIDPRRNRFRSIGYHVHMGVERPEKLAVTYGHTSYIPTSAKVASDVLHSTNGRVRLVQMCDLLVGLPAVFIERDPRVAVRRQEIGYGKAGEFREQPHGFEYRTLGPWPMYHPMWTWWANAACRDALQLVINDVDEKVKYGIDMKLVSKAINENNMAGALPIWNQFKKNLGPILPSWLAQLGVSLLDSHPMLHPETLRKFEFLIFKRPTITRTLPVRLWRAMDKRYTNQAAATYIAFPSHSEGLCARYEDWAQFKAEWSLDKDMLSKGLV